MAVDVLLRLIANTLASSHIRAPFAVSASQHSAARTPRTLLAAIVTPVPVHQKRTPWSALLLLTSSPIFSPTSGQPIASPFKGPKGRPCDPSSSTPRQQSLSELSSHRFQ